PTTLALMDLVPARSIKVPGGPSGSRVSVNSPADLAPVTGTARVCLPSWVPLRPGSVATPSRLYFIDGVRRLESRLVVRCKGDILHGGFGSFAVGCVEVRPGRASFGETRPPCREVVLGSGKCLPRDVPVRGSLVYAARSAKGAE